MADRKIDQVLIVGAGPTGMTAALELSRFGIPVRLIERLKEPMMTSRAVGVQARTLELFEQRGLADELVQAGNPAVAASAYGGGKRVFRLEFDRIDSRYNFLLFVSQSVTEKVLRSALARADVKIERGVVMTAFAQPERKGEIVATLCHDDGSLEQTTASYLIDCEGAHSIVRTTLGLHFDGKALDDNYALGDLYVEGDLTETDFHVFSSDHGFMGMFPMGKRRFRLIASNPLSKPSKDTEPQIEELQKIYDARSPIPARLHDMSWSSWFQINSRMIHTLQVNHVFFGGDSAHIHSPAGAQGMNTGIQDMIDLGWKLAMVIKGQASQALLATYAEDRLPVIKNVLTKTEGLTDLIGSENPTLRAIFNHVAPLLVGTKFIQENSTTRMSQIGLNYRDSDLSETHAHPGKLHGGDRVPDMELTVVNAVGTTDTVPRQQRLFKLFDPSKFTLLFVNVDRPTELHQQVQAELGRWCDRINGFEITAGDDAEQREHFEETFGRSPSIVLVRPDSYVGFIGDRHAVSKLATYLKKWLTTDEA